MSTHNNAELSQSYALQYKHCYASKKPPGRSR